MTICKYFINKFNLTKQVTQHHNNQREEIIKKSNNKQNQQQNYSMQTSSKLDDHSGLKDSLSLKYISHYKGEFKNSLFFDLTNPKENKLIYPSCNAIAFNMLSASFQNEKTQYFINCLTGSKGIVCLTQSPNKRYIAWCEETENYPVIFLVDLQNGNVANYKKKTFASADVKGSKYISLAFNGNEITDPKFLVALTNGPQYQLVQWNFQKGKFFIHTLDKPQKNDKQQSNLNIQRFNQIFFYRQEDTIVVMGKGNLKFFKIATDKVQLKDSPFARREINQKDFNFTSFCVLKDGLVIGTDNGDLLYFAINGEFKSILYTSPGENYSIQTLLYLPNSNKSFLVGGSDGLLALYQKSDSKQAKNIYMRSERKFNLHEHKGKVTSLVATPKEDQMVIGMSTGVILKMSLDKNQQPRCQHAIQSFHTDNITGLDICLRKSLVATCSSDRTVRIWNYLQKNTLQIIKQFEQKPLSLSFHPSGLHLIVSFSDKVRMMNILQNELVHFKDLSIKNCYSVKFSHGGHLFAVVNNVMAQIFNFYTLDQPPHYQFKPQAGKFQTLTWQEDDLAVFLGTYDGFVYYYKLEDPSVKLQVLSAPGLNIKTIASVFVGKDEKLGLINQRSVYVGGTFNSSISNQNKCIYEVKITPKSEKDKDRELTVKQDLVKYTVSTPSRIFTNSNVSKIIFLNSKKVFLYCTDEKEQPGAIRYCRYPLNLNKEIYELQSHTKRINEIVLSFDDNYIFSAGEEGEFICYEFKDKESKNKVEIPDLSQEFLYSKQKLIGQKKLLEQLKTQNFDAKEKRDKLLRESKAQHDRLLNEWNFKISDRQRVQKDKYEREVQQISRMQKQQSLKLTRLQIEHKQKRQTVQKDYADKLQLQQTRFSELGKMRQADNRRFNEMIQTIKNNHIKKKQKNQIQYQDQLRKEEEEVRQFEKIYQKKKFQYDEEQQKFQNQAERQIKVKKEENQTNIKALQEQNNKAEAEKRHKKTQYDKQERNLQQQKHRLKHTLEDIEKIKQKHQENLQKKISQSKEIQERQKTIRDKMMRINELKKKTQELEKFKFVLDYKIKELKRDIGPREEQIAKMKEQIASMNAEIIHFKRTNQNMNLIVKDLVSKRSGMEKEINQLNTAQSNNLSYIKSFQYDISDMYHNCIEDYKALKSKIIEVYRKYVQEENKKKMDGIDQQKQFIKERAHLESTVKGLKEKFKKSIDLHEADNKRIMSQNEELISEINDLKREKKNLKDENKKRQVIKENAQKLQEQNEFVDREFDNMEKTLRQLKSEYEKKIKRKKQAPVEA